MATVTERLAQLRARLTEAKDVAHPGAVLRAAIQDAEALVRAIEECPKAEGQAWLASLTTEEAAGMRRLGTILMTTGLGISGMASGAGKTRPTAPPMRASGMVS